MYCTRIDIQLPRTDEQHEAIVRPGTDELSTGASVPTIAGSSCMSCGSTAAVNPNIPQNPFKGSARAQI
jgi:hypothetical protein